MRNCKKCAEVTRQPAKAHIHPWNWPTNPFDRVHVDFFGPFYGKSYLILVDSHSKWIEVEILKHTHTAQTITVLRRWFSQFGIISNNFDLQQRMSKYENKMKDNNQKGTSVHAGRYDLSKKSSR